MEGSTSGVTDDPHHKRLDQHLQILQVANCDVYTGNGIPTIWGRLFGGQIIAQSLLAAAETVPKTFLPTSLHAYFLIAGDSRTIIMYSVERIHSGKSFCTRRVTASQSNRAIFTLTVQFSREGQHGGEYQTPPEELMVVLRHFLHDPVIQYNRKNEIVRFRRFQDLPAPDKMVLAGAEVLKDSMTGNIERVTIARGHRWILQWTRHKKKLPSRSMSVHMAVFAFLSDHGMVAVCRQPHELDGRTELVNGFSASLDHSIHFHRPFDVDKWFLAFYETSISRSARGTATAQFFDLDANLLATTKQEVLMRPGPRGAL